MSFSEFLLFFNVQCSILSLTFSKCDSAVARPSPPPLQPFPGHFPISNLVSLCQQTTLASSLSANLVYLADSQVRPSALPSHHQANVPFDLLDSTNPDSDNSPLKFPPKRFPYEHRTMRIQSESEFSQSCSS